MFEPEFTCKDDVLEYAAQLGKRADGVTDLTERNLHDFTLDLLRKSSRRNVLYTHIPLGIQSANGRKAGRWQIAMGARRGAADFLIVMNGRAGFLELKTKKGKQSLWQKQFELDALDAGALYALARSPEDVTAILIKWGAIRAVEMMGRAA